MPSLRKRAIPRGHKGRKGKMDLLDPKVFKASQELPVQLGHKGLRGLPDHRVRPDHKDHKGT